MFFEAKALSSAYDAKILTSCWPKIIASAVNDARGPDDEPNPIQEKDFGNHNSYTESPVTIT